MGDPIEVNYIPDGDDWTVTAKGRGQTLTGRAPGLIAARDRADQMVEKLAPDEKHRTVVHTLNGDAVEFTTAYLTARLAKPEPVAVAEAPAEEPVKAQAAELAKPSPTPRPTPPPVPAPSSPQSTSQQAPQPAPQPAKAEEPASP